MFLPPVQATPFIFIEDLTHRPVNPELVWMGMSSASVTTTVGEARGGDGGMTSTSSSSREDREEVLERLSRRLPLDELEDDEDVEDCVRSPEDAGADWVRVSTAVTSSRARSEAAATSTSMFSLMSEPILRLEITCTHSVFCR